MPLEIKPVKVKPTNNEPIRGKDVAATLYGLTGAYTNKDLYARYLSVCAEAGQPPASAARFSRTVSSYPFEPWRTATARGWHLHHRWIFATN